MLYCFLVVTFGWVLFRLEDGAAYVTNFHQSQDYEKKL